MRTPITRVVLLAALVSATAARADAPPVTPTQSGEVITIDSPRQKPVPARPLRDPRLIPAYSDRAALGNYWSRAWLLLDVDATGAVTRLKFLHRPGHDLDAIAVATGLAARFEPARDDHGRVTRTQVIYPIEWPAMWWLVGTYGMTTRVPSEEHLAHMRCIGDGPQNLGMLYPTQRDCTKPDLSHYREEPWIARVSPTRARTGRS